MSIVNGTKIVTLVSAANGDSYGDAERHFFRTAQALLQANAISMALSTPPGSPSNGDTYVVGASPTGAWAAQANNIAYWAVDAQDGVVTTGIWEFYTPLAGWVVYDVSRNKHFTYTGSAWVPSNLAPRKIINGAATGALVLDASQGNVFAMTLSGNVTSVTINNPTDGQTLTLLWNQGGVAFTVSYTGSTFRGATAIGATINKSSVQQFQYDTATTSWIGLSTGQQNI